MNFTTIIIYVNVFSQLCERLMDGTSYSVVQDLELGVPYAYETAGSTWISYDDAASARIKVIFFS